jgi:hypothetical protein
MRALSLGEALGRVQQDFIEGIAICYGFWLKQFRSILFQ